MNEEVTQKILRRAMKREGLYPIGYSLYSNWVASDGRSTVVEATINDPEGKYWGGLGFSHCNPKDKFNQEIGEAIAMSRAARAAAAKIKQALEEES